MFLKTSNNTGLNNLIVPSSIWICRQLGNKKAKGDGKTKSEPWWKRRIEDRIEIEIKLNRNIILLARHKNGEVKS